MAFPQDHPRNRIRRYLRCLLPFWRLYIQFRTFDHFTDITLRYSISAFRVKLQCLIQIGKCFLILEGKGVEVPHEKIPIIILFHFIRMAPHDCDGPFAEFRMIGIIKASNLPVNFCQKQIYLSGMKAWRKIFQFGHGRFQISIFLHLASGIKNCLRTHLFASLEESPHRSF